MSDRITLTGVSARGFHGVLASEREKGQDFVVDLTAWVDLSTAASSDDLTDTIDYDLLAREIVAILQGEPVNLIEALAERIAEQALRHVGIVEVEVVVHKPQAPITVPFADVSVTVRRSAR